MSEKKKMELTRLQCGMAIADNEAAKGVLSAGAPKVFFKYFYVDSATGETSVPMQTMVKWAQTEADPDPDEP